MQMAFETCVMGTYSWRPTSKRLCYSHQLCFLIRKEVIVSPLEAERKQFLERHVANSTPISKQKRKEDEHSRITFEREEHTPQLKPPPCFPELSTLQKLEICKIQVQSVFRDLHSYQYRSTVCPISAKCIFSFITRTWQRHWSLPKSNSSR